MHSALMSVRAVRGREFKFLSDEKIHVTRDLAHNSSTVLFNYCYLAKFDELDFRTRLPVLLQLLVVEKFELDRTC